VVQGFIQDKTFNSELLLLNSGQSYDFDEKQKYPKGSYQHFTEEDKDNYIRQFKDKKYDHEHFALNANVPLDRLVKMARSRMWEMQNIKKFFPNFNFYLDIPDLERRFKIDLTDENIENVSITATCEQPFLRISTPGTLMMLLLVGHVSWNIADAALFLDYERQPNIYDTKIYEFLNYLRV
jgi:UDP-MurNAc hydroxylase